MNPRSLLLSACALACLSAPAVALAEGAPNGRPPHAGPAHPGGWRHEWRNQHRGWDHRAPWRGGRWWWRHHWAFRLYAGPRIGFFFVPEIGYVAFPPGYAERAWAPGDVLPSWYLRYQIKDYAQYHLGAPPAGCAWVWVGRDVALVDLADGYIVDIVHNVW